MSGSIRRIVTGHDSNGKAIVISDGPGAGRENESAASRPCFHRYLEDERCARADNRR
jgi:hypothetical protein